MKRIGIYLSSGPHSGGTYQYCLSIIKKLKILDKKKYKITAFIVDKNWSNKLPKSFKIINIKTSGITDRFLNYLGIILHSKKIYKKINNFFSTKIKLLNNSNCDYIIFPSQEDLSSKIYLKSISVIHDLMHRYEKSFKEYGIFECLKRDIQYKRICNNSFKILADSKLGKKQIIESYNVDKKKIEVNNFETPDYLNFSKLKNIYKKYDFPKKKFIFYPAQFWEHKNHINLIRAFKLVSQKSKYINLVLSGVDKNNLENVNNEIKKQNLRNNIYIIGYIDMEDIYSFYKKAVLLAYVSHCGPTNIPPLEGMKLGCPVLYSNVYGMPNQIGKGGIKCNPRSYKDIYKKIEFILTNQKFRKEIIKRGYEQNRRLNLIGKNNIFDKILL